MAMLYGVFLALRVNPVLWPPQEVFQDLHVPVERAMRTEWRGKADEKPGGQGTILGALAA
jgi:hypothetical protein